MRLVLAFALALTLPACSTDALPTPHPEIAARAYLLSYCEGVPTDQFCLDADINYLTVDRAILTMPITPKAVADGLAPAICERIASGDFAGDQAPIRGATWKDLGLKSVRIILDLNGPQVATCQVVDQS